MKKVLLSIDVDIAVNIPAIFLLYSRQFVEEDNGLRWKRLLVFSRSWRPNDEQFVRTSCSLAKHVTASLKIYTAGRCHKQHNGDILTGVSENNKSNKNICEQISIIGKTDEKHSTCQTSKYITWNYKRVKRKKLRKNA